MLPLPLAFALTGALVNRAIMPFFGTTLGLLLHAGTFGLMVGWAMGDVAPGVLAAMGMALGQAPGYTRYVGALAGWEEELEEWWPVDALIYEWRDEPKAWGVWGLALRGLTWGGCLSLALWSVWPALVGVLMPAVYGITIAACDKYPPRIYQRDYVYKWGATLYGALLWFAAGIACL